MSSKMPSESQIAVSVRGLSKAYTIAHNAPRHTTVGEALLDKLKNPLRRSQTETFWALEDVSFNILKGEVVGIIGRNGAGKSTLLKILSQITEPTRGEILLYGRVGSLLEVGTGFHPELSGRENIFLNGAILGMRRSEIQRQFDAIVDFAEVEEFLDTPVKRYSSGMYVRLAFAVAAHLNPEILIVDEVLAVGDAAFQKKCLGKMHDVAEQEGRTILFVSHNIRAVAQLCSRAIVVHGGRIRFDGEVKEGVEFYNRETLALPHGALNLPPHVLYEASGSALEEEFAITRIEMVDSMGIPKLSLGTMDDVTLRIYYKCARFVEAGSVALEVSTFDEVPILMLSTQPDCMLPLSLPIGLHCVECVVSGFPLAAGEYVLSAGLAIPNVEWLCHGPLAQLTVEPRDILGSGFAPVAPRALAACHNQWRTANK